MANANGTMNWKVDVSNYMGHKYEQYKNKLYAKALTKPSSYFDTQSDVIEALNKEIAQKVYDIFYNLLTLGKLPNDKGNLSIDGDVLVPAWPSQAATTFALEASNEIDQIISKCVGIILPQNIVDISKMQIEKKVKDTRN